MVSFKWHIQIFPSRSESNMRLQASEQMVLSLLTYCKLFSFIQKSENATAVIVCLKDTLFPP